MLSTTRNSTRTRIVSDVEKRGIPRRHAPDEEKSTKPALSTKSASSKTLSKEVGKMLSLINNALKTMGKALIKYTKRLVP